MEKPVRVRIAAQFPGRIARNGLTVREHSARLAFDRLPVAVKKAMAERGKAALANQSCQENDKRHRTDDGSAMPQARPE